MSEWLVNAPDYWRHTSWRSVVGLLGVESRLHQQYGPCRRGAVGCLGLPPSRGTSAGWLAVPVPRRIGGCQNRPVHAEARPYRGPKSNFVAAIVRVQSPVIRGVRSALFLLEFFQQWFNKIHRKREHDCITLIASDFDQCLQIAELDSLRLLYQGLGSFHKLL